MSGPPCALSQGSATVSGMGHLLGSARVSTTDQQPHLQVDALKRTAATGCSPRPPPAPAPTGPPWSRSWISCTPPTPWSSGNSIAWAAHFATWSTPSPAWPSGASASGACRRRSTPPRRVASRLSRLCRPGRVRTRPHPRTHQRWAVRSPGPGRHGGRPAVLTGHKLQVAREMYRSGQYTVAGIAETLGVMGARSFHCAGAPLAEHSFQAKSTPTAQASVSVPAWRSRSPRLGCWTPRYTAGLTASIGVGADLGRPDPAVCYLMARPPEDWVVGRVVVGPVRLGSRPVRECIHGHSPTFGPDSTWPGLRRERQPTPRPVATLRVVPSRIVTAPR
jgi:hypothetical protein